METQLTEAVESFAQALQPLSDPQLDTPWAWRDYDSEGLRFACFRTYEELRTLAVELHAARAAAPSQAQQILGLYQRAYRDLSGALLGLTPADCERPPAEGEWPIRTAVAHLVGAEISFYVASKFALDRARAGEAEALKAPPQAWAALLELPGVSLEQIEALLDGPLADMLAFHARHQRRIIQAFVDVTAAELDLPVLFWESAPYSLRFRLHRFDSHLRQHTIQIDKTRLALGKPPSEAQRLVRLIYSALAEAEAAGFGLEAAGLTAGAGPAAQPVAAAIAARAEEVRTIIR